MTQSRDHFFITHTRTIVALLFGLSFSVVVAYATPPGSAYTPGETLDPTCAPGDVNCTVGVGAVLTFSTGLTNTANTITNNLSTGVAGGQSVIGGTASGNDLTLSSTAHATKGKIIFGTSAYDEANNRLGIGTVTPATKFDLRVTAPQLAAIQVTDGTDSYFTVNAVAAESNFIGVSAGQSATNATNSNFFGYTTGYGATNAAQSNFIGAQAGRDATNATNSNFFGVNAGYGATNANNSIFIGYAAGTNDTVNNVGDANDFSILIGRNTSTGSFKNSIAIGGSATNTAANQLMLGSSTREINQVVINGISAYLNFTGTYSGALGYGIRDNGGTMEVKSFGGSWAPISAGASYTFTDGLTNTAGAVTNDFFTGKGSSQTLYGGAIPGGELIIASTPDSTTRGRIVLGSRYNLMVWDETNGYLGIAVSTPTAALDMLGAIKHSGGNVAFDVTTGTANISTDTYPGGLLDVSDTGVSSIGDATGDLNGTYMLVDDANSKIMFTNNIQFQNYGAGNAIFDASGNITSSSDERLKDIQGVYTSGLAELINLNPIIYKWNSLSKLETEHIYAGFSAQNVQTNIPYGTGENNDGYLSLQERAITATIVNAIKEMNINMVGINDLDTENVWRDSLVGWFGDITNGIGKIFAGEVETKQLCVSDDSGAKTCITKSELDALLHSVGR